MFMSNLITYKLIMYELKIFHAERMKLMMAALCNRGDIIFLYCGFFRLSFFLSSPNLSRRRLDVYHTSTHGVVLLRI